MGINGIVVELHDVYGGVANRIHNVQVVSHLVDNTLIRPGKEFSFNGTTGERNAAKGLLEAPVIINGELENGLGGGTCQVSTTVFNAAYEAGLPITARTNHALYISHYPQGRDATVNYPDIDLKFVNDTDHWLLLRTFVSASTLTVNLYGTPHHRRVECGRRAARVTGPVPREVTKTRAPQGQEGGRRAGLAAAVDQRTRRVYDAKGKLLYENTWYSSYVGERRTSASAPSRSRSRSRSRRRRRPEHLLPADLVDRRRTTPADHHDPPLAPASAAAIASASHSGSRVG